MGVTVTTNSAATYEPIATQTLGTAATSITFNSIPSTYTDLRVVFIGTGGNFARLIFNADTTTSYSCTNMLSDGSTKASSRETTVAYMTINAPGYGLGIGQPLLITVDIPSYTNTSVYKSALATWSAAYSGAGYATRTAGLWRNTAAISSLTIDSAQSNQMYAGTIVTLYGIKAA